MSAQRIVVVGAGFAGLKCVQRLERELKGELARGEVEIVVVNPHDYMLYLPLLPQVAAGVITAQSVTVPLPRAIHRSQRLPGQVVGLDLERKVAVVKKISGDVVDLPYDRLVLAPGSVTRQFDIPGLEEHGLGMKNLGEAAYLRDHVHLAARAGQRRPTPGTSAGPAASSSWSAAATRAPRRPRPSSCSATPRSSGSRASTRRDVRWTLVDIAPRLMPELGPAPRRGGAASCCASAASTSASRPASTEVTEDTRHADRRRDAALRRPSCGPRASPRARW